jgi:putative toxin-antitoxin system antitoxin component (TIGR02293 family)
VYICRKEDKMNTPDNIESKKILTEYLQEFSGSTILQEKEVTYERVLKNKLFVARAVRRGVTFDLFKEIRSNAPFTDTQWAEFLGVNLRTLQRYKKDKKHIFNSLQSERIFELAEVVSLATSIFDTKEHFHIWLNSPSVALGGRKAYCSIG